MSTVPDTKLRRQGGSEPSPALFSEHGFRFLMGCQAKATNGNLGEISLQQIRGLVEKPPKAKLPFEVVDDKPVIVDKNSMDKAKRNCAVVYTSDCASRSKLDIIKHNRHGSLNIDIDKGNPSISRVQATLNHWGIGNYYIYTTATSDMYKPEVVDGETKLRPLGKRLRIIIPTLPNETNLHCQLTRFITDTFDGDMSMVTPNQASFLPVDSETGRYEFTIKDGPPLDPQNLPCAFSTAFEAYCAKNPISDTPLPKEEIPTPINYGPFEEVEVSALGNMHMWPLTVRKFDREMDAFEFNKAQDVFSFAEYAGYRYVAPVNKDTLRYDKPRPGPINTGDAGVFISAGRIRSLHEKDPINSVGSSDILGKSIPDLRLAHIYGGDSDEHISAFVRDTYELMRAIGQRIKNPTIDTNTQVTVLGKPTGPFPSRKSLCLYSPIPPRPFLFNRYYVKGFLTGTAASGGVGKTSLVDAEVVSMAIGRNLLEGGIDLKTGPLKIVIFSLEDDYDEARRRYQAIALEYMLNNDDKASMENNIDFRFGDEAAVKVVTKTSGALSVNNDAIEGICRAIQVAQADVVIVDPLVSIHSASESVTEELQLVAEVLRGIARRTSTAVHYLHHVRKGSTGHAEDMRGAVALKDASRALRMLTRLTKEEAQKLGLSEEEASCILTAQSGKHNFSTPTSTPAMYRTVPQHLNNATEDFDEDIVGVVRPYSKKSVFADFNYEQCNEARLLVKTLPQEKCRTSIQSPDWIGNSLAKVLELDTKKDKAKIKNMINQWVSAQFWKEIKIKGNNSKQMPVYAPGEKMGDPPVLIISQ